MTFDRPHFNRMIAEIEAGNVATVIIKDMSRLGRDYLKVGYYTEIFFVERDMRYITINDGVDSAKGDNDFTPFHNLFNDFYAKDTSKKVGAIKRAQGMAGKHLTKPPSCPNCGCPVSVMPFQTLSPDVDAPGNVTPATFKMGKKVGPVQIDETNRLFRIYGAVPTNKKKTGLVGATFKGMMAVLAPLPEE